jgi:hypothetical protein
MMGLEIVIALLLVCIVASSFFTALAWFSLWLWYPPLPGYESGAPTDDAAPTAPQHDSGSNSLPHLRLVALTIGVAWLFVWKTIYEMMIEQMTDSRFGLSPLRRGFGLESFCYATIGLCLFLSLVLWFLRWRWRASERHAVVG